MTTDRRKKCPLPVLGHCAVALDEVVIVWGGYTTEEHLIDRAYIQLLEPYVDPRILWIYNPEYDQWRAVVTQGDVPPGTSGAGTVLMDSSMYVFGGYTNIGNSNNLYRLRLNSMVWELLEHNVTQQPSPRDKFMYWTHSHRLYVFGGFGLPPSNYLNEHGQFMLDESPQWNRGWNNQLFIYDTKEDTWSNPKCSGTIPSPRAAGAATCIGGKVYLFGGRHSDTRLNDLHVLDLGTLEWTRLFTAGLSPPGRSWHSFTAINQTQVVLFGGYTQDQFTMNDLWLLDVDHLEWTQCGVRTQLSHRLWHSASFTTNQDLVVFGGCSNDILSMEETARSHNEVFVLRFVPHKLSRLCLDVAHVHRDRLEKEFISLPRNLQQLLASRLHTPHDDEVEEDAGSARTCTLS